VAGERNLVGCATDASGQVTPCPEVTLRMVDAACATRIGQRGEAQKLRREAALILKHHLELERMEQEGRQ
jgi:hypothetical protein